jgi:uncharacterized protein YxeA
MDTKKIVLIILALILLPGGIFAAWFIYKGDKKTTAVDPASGESLWVNYIVSANENPNYTNDLQRMIAVSDLVDYVTRVFSCTGAAFYAANPSLKTIDYLEYGSTILVPKK